MDLFGENIEASLKKFAFIDTEGTGLSPFDDRITDIGILIYENGKITKVYETLVNPDKYIPPYLTYITGITNEMVRKAPRFHEIADELHEILKDKIFVAHNARFDYGFIQKEFERVGKDFKSEMLCTVRLSKHLFPEHKKHGLDEIIQRFEIKCKRRHRAFDDAEAMYQFYEKVKDRLSEKDFKKLIYNLN